MKTRRIFAVILMLAVILTAAAGFTACDKAEETAPLPAFLKAADSSDGYATVYIPADRDIKIMVLSDPQIDLTQKYKNVGSLGNDATYEFIKDFVASSTPDLVIINGDMVMDNTSKNNAPYFKRYADIFEELQTPWMPVFGNHDCEAGWTEDYVDVDDEVGQVSKATLVDYLSSFKHCLISSDTACTDGAGNYFVNVKKADGTLVYTLCAFDCVGDDEEMEYMVVPTAAQISWYKQTINKLSDAAYGTSREADKVVPSMIFNHVGIPEFKTAWNEAWNGGNPTSAYHYGVHLSGNYTDNEDGVPEDEKFFNQVLALGSTKAIFMCHHHDNDFSVDYKGVRLTFGQHSGVSHNYRTTHDTNGVTLGEWSGISFKRVDNYGDNRGGTEVSISADQAFDVQPVYARDVISNFYDDYYIDYDAVAAAIEADDAYSGTVARGSKRLWKQGWQESQE